MNLDADRDWPPAPEPASKVGKDAFHRVPFILGEVRDAVERTGVQLTQRLK